MPAKKRLSPWIKFGVPVAILVIIGVVVGVVVGTRHNSSSTSSASSSGGSSPAAASSAVSAKNAIGIFATATDSYYEMPLYPSTTNSAAFTSPTFISGSSVSWPSDPFQPADPQPTVVRTDRPRLIAPAYKWQALPDLIANDVYMSYWNESIFNNATQYYSLAPVVYHMDGDSGILDNSREIKMRIKAFAYAYRMSNDTKWVDRAWSEIQNAAGNGTTSFGPDDDKWNSAHFLDTAEMTAAFAIAYDWLYDMWTPDQRSQIMFTMIKYGLSFGQTAFTDLAIGWWSNNVTGNWNCVCNDGLTLGALAILGDDTTGIADSILGLTVPNAKANCAFGPSTDGTWSETANYWYFGTTGHAEMASALMTATGSDHGLLDTNTNYHLTALYHMYSMGATSLFDWGDHGPNKFSSTANSMMFYSMVYNTPMYALFQRDQHDAAEPWSMFWYDPTVSGAFWDGLALDHFFDDELTQWGSMRSSWTDINALYVGMKAGKNQGHQTHNDLDAGDFVLDAMGYRFAGEYGSADYLSLDYFSNDTQDSVRWLYYRKRTEGQNAIIVDAQNQNVAAAPSIKHDTSGTQQGSSTVFDVPGDSTAYFVADLTSAYFNVSSYQRGIRMINGRKQVLLQDDITASAPIMWRLQTNATVSVDSSGTSATLTIEGKVVKMEILNAPSGATITTGDAVRLASDPPLPAGQSDQPNPGVTVVSISLDAGTYSLQVLFSPQWDGMSASDFKTPPAVSLDNWSLTSHD
ncbi:heparinase II/III family protein [Punctularia strigosozonata HHB-11173 SS5]|uniref:heparinase II/III family protein n=1 Tax=Punctularia strigosozonata (strain HHB-11173) TaxID=741275 RepID=UPI0004417DC0|nr:heparinase II/III family protein [Punctularia strigosozonata HHB-11173 SS5]EIN14048.1 heparinase II/III family protein [Punctularia strigosozonata HHB-11173 SS5]